MLARLVMKDELRLIDGKTVWLCKVVDLGNAVQFEVPKAIHRHVEDNGLEIALAIKSTYPNAKQMWFTKSSKN